MSKRRFRKARDTNPQPSFKDLVKMGQIKKIMSSLTPEQKEEIVKSMAVKPTGENVVPVVEHVHGEHCNHEHS